MTDISHYKKKDGAKRVQSVIDSFKSLTPEQRLWRCVLVETLVDAISYVEGQKTYSCASAEEMRDAFGMVYEQTRDFSCICRLSDLDPDSVRSALMDYVIDLDCYSEALYKYENDLQRFDETSMDSF